MNIRETKSGKYQCRQMIEGKSYTFTLDHKPTKKEIALLVAKAVEQSACGSTRMTLSQGIDAYIKSKENVIAVSTIRGYRAYAKNMSEKFLSKKIEDITPADIQKYVSDMMADHSAKYTKNVIGLVMAVLGLYRPQFHCKVTYPSVTKEDAYEAYMPTTEDVSRLIEASAGTEYEVPLMLAASCGLRRGEICALTINDLSKDNILTINKDMVMDTDGNWVIKPPKTRKSVRTLYVPQFIADKIREKGYIYKGYPNSIYDWMQGMQKKLGIPNFTLHKLRHYFCSELSHANIDEATILALGGWSDPSVMKRVYRHSKKDEDRMRQASAIASAWHK